MLQWQLAESKKKEKRTRALDRLAISIMALMNKLSLSVHKTLMMYTVSVANRRSCAIWPPNPGQLHSNLISGAPTTKRSKLLG